MTQTIDRRGQRPGRAAAAAVLGLTTTQLLAGTFASGLEQFNGKAFGARLVAYPAMMLVVPAVYWLVRRQRDGAEPLPWGAFALIMAPFLVDVTGNTLDLYDTVSWWDDANHFGNWLLLHLGVGLLLRRALPDLAGWVLVLLVTGFGAALAIVWELGEWYTFIRHGTELATAYTDTLGDETLGTLGALAAGLVVSRIRLTHDGGTVHTV